MMTDPIADLLTQVRNASNARLPKVDVPSSNLKVSIVDLWKSTGYVRNYRLFKQNNMPVLRVYLKYVGKNKPVIQGIRRVSKPSRRVYTSAERIPKVLDGLGVAIVSTSKGMLTDTLAREQKVGGEIICTIW